MDTRAGKPTLPDLPAEILSAIIENLSRDEDITSFRLTCRRVGNFAVSKASLYRKVNLCLHPWSRTRFELIAFNKIPGRAGDWVNSSFRVKDLIFEDIRVLYSDMYFDLSKIGVDLPGYPEDLSSQLEQFEHQLYYDPSGVDTIGAAAKQLNALETIEYDPGSTRAQRARGHNHRLSDNAYVDPEAGYEELWQIQELIEKNTWESRSRCFLALTQQDAIHATRYMFCKVVGSVLQNRHPRAKPLTVRICSPVPRFFNSTRTAALYSNSTYLVRFPEWPTNNRLHNLELRYTSLQMYRVESVMTDLGVLCGDLADGQFANLRSLTLGGSGIHGTNYLSLDVLGEAEFRPDWTSLEKLRLENVCVSLPTIHWLRKQRLHLEIHNATWRYLSFLEFQAGTMLYTVKFTGIHWRSDVLNNDTVRPVTAPQSLRLMYHLHSAWIVAESSTEAERIGPFHYHEDSCSIPWNPKQRWVEQKTVEQYILQGGTDPMTGDNMWCDKWEATEAN
jgi:hypothetical protein